MTISRALTLATILLSLTSQVKALWVTDGSPCYSTCNGSASNSWVDLVCSDEDFASSAKGQLLEPCLNCQSTSLFQNGSSTDNDEWWFMFTMKYTQQYCLIDNTTAHIGQVINCAEQCNPLQPVLDTLWLATTPYADQYAYCSIENDTYTTYAPACADCLQAQSGSVILGNFIKIMNKACKDQPRAANGDLVTLPRALFDTSTVPTTTASTTSQSTASATSSSSTGQHTASTTSAAPTTTTSAAGSGTGSKKGGLSTGAQIGIGVGVGIVAASAITGFIVYLCMRKRRTSPSHPPPVYTELGAPTRDWKSEKPAKITSPGIQEAPSHQVTPELSAHNVVEAHSDYFAPPVELPAESRR